MEPNPNVASMTKRLKRIEGQLRGITKMLEEGKPCPEVLIQISSARSALQKVGQLLLETHAAQCLQDGLRTGDAEDAAQQLCAAIEQFSRIV